MKSLVLVIGLLPPVGEVDPIYSPLLFFEKRTILLPEGTRSASDMVKKVTKSLRSPTMIG